MIVMVSDKKRGDKLVRISNPLLHDGYLHFGSLQTVLIVIGIVGLLYTKKLRKELSMMALKLEEKLEGEVRNPP